MSDVAAWGDYIGWTGSDGFGQEPRRAHVWNTRTRATTLLATARRGESIDWVRGDADSVTYQRLRTTTDQAGVDHYQWAIHLVDLKTRSDVVIDTSDTAGSKLHLTSPSLSWPWLSWDKGVSDNRWNIFVRDLRTGSTRQVIHNVNVNDQMVSGNTLIWVHCTNEGLQSGDVEALDLASGSTRHLTDTRVVSRLYARDGNVAYTQIGVDGRSNAIWRLDPKTGLHTLLQRVEAFTPVAGANFTAWLANDNVTIQRGASQPVILVKKNASIRARLYATPHRLVYGSVTYDSTSTIDSETLHYIDVPL